ncbi:SIS domain-containing protein [Paenibacillus frigoriresistens]|uniref:SIS domain-containing protein n=1 Tax=Paenibacillus alginolyticus TaxID=59839 RepID=UPI0015669F20|nr:SIS domain-containing protein [Paenibacillus frigoriresistens]NRF94416.1 SIS domain-containing protein [Paenibacillus frigoriresistens]
MTHTSQTNKYIQFLRNHFDKALTSQTDRIEQAANLIKESVLQGGRFFVFGSGHSHMIAEEIYIRAGGFALVNAILEPALMLHEEPNKSTLLERLSGYAEVLLKIKEITPRDTLMIISNSGRNPVIVEMAVQAKEMGVSMIAMTSIAHSSQVTSRHESGKRLFEVADVVLDNGAEFGDAAFYLDGLETPTGPTSDFTGIALAQTLIVATLEALIREGFNPPVYRSSNVDGADAYNDILFKKYAK